MIRIAGTILATILFAAQGTAESEDQADRPPANPASGRCRVESVSTIEPDYLDECRPQPVSQAWKDRILSSLPMEGEVRRLDRPQRRRLEASMEVLRVLNRESVYEIKVIDVPQAFSGLYGKAVLFISLPVLRLLRAEELQAIVAHEVGHEYLWEEYEVAQKRMDNQRLRELEIACDAIAVLILSRLGLPSDRLTDALDKLSRFNHGRFGAALNESSYPSLEDRRRAMKRLTAVRLSWPK